MSLMERFDAAESAFFQRELETILAESFDIRFPQLKAREFIPVSNEGDPGAKTITYRQFDYRGRAIIIGAKADDLPRVDVFGTEFEQPVVKIGDSYGWDLDEILAAQKVGRPLTRMKAEKARREIEVQIDQIAFSGAPDNGIATGFANDTNVTVTAAAGLWNAATPDAIIGDVAGMVSRTITSTEDVEEPTDLILPPAAWVIVATQRLTDTGSTTLQFIQNQFNLRVSRWNRLTNAGAGGAVDRAVTYNRSPANLQLHIPLEFQTLPVQESGLEFIVNAWAKTAGTIIQYPLTMQYLDTL